MVSKALINSLRGVCAVAMVATSGAAFAQEPAAVSRSYQNRLTRLIDPPPLLADYPEFVQPVVETVRYEAPRLVDDAVADLEVRAWRFSYNARGIIEMPNRLKAAETAVIMVHPWGIDDGQGWTTPEPAGVADFCTVEKNHLAARHTREVIGPFLKRLRGQAAFILYSLPGDEDPIRRKCYRSFTHTPDDAERAEGKRELLEKLASFTYRGEPLPETLELSSDKPVIDYFAQFPGLDAGARYNAEGFWKLPIPVTSDLEVDPQDVVIYDAAGYPPLKEFLQSHGVRHVLLTGYATDMCFCRTTAGYENLSRDFNVFLVGDATLATFPANATPKYATNAHISFAALNQLITQVSWVKSLDQVRAEAAVNDEWSLSRRAFLAGAASALATTSLRAQPPARKAQIAITLDLEMSREYPQRGMTEWDYQKGNLDDATKGYAVGAARRVKAHGGRIHFFCVGRVLEQADVEWLNELAAEGHPIGNHTYDHVYVKAVTPEETQFRFRRAPWLIRGQSAAEIVRENIRITSAALKERTNIEAAGFRTPGGFNNGLEDRPDVQQMLLDLGFTWVSSRYPAHELGVVGEPPTEAVLRSIVAAQKESQPFVYPSGLIEVPMSPISDVTAFRSQRWKLPDFLKALRLALAEAIATGGAFDFLAHPSCLVVEDPEFASIELLCQCVQEAPDRAEFADLTAIAARVAPAKP